jgi:hypothetical protein
MLGLPGREVRRAIRNHRYEVGPEGLLLPAQKVQIGGVFEHDVRRGGALLGARTDHNLMTDEGLNHILDVILHGVSAVASWYVAPFKGNYTPVPGVTAASVTADSTEATEYDEATRVEYNEAAASSKSITNSANKATFTISASITAYGAFLVSASAKSATSGVLLAISRFTASRSLVDDDELLVTYTLSAADA